MLVGFHGYGEDADIQLDRLAAIPESHRWTTVSIQALHRFYQRRTSRVVASWMTRQDRELAIIDNVQYVSKCIEAVATEWPITSKIMFVGFSQGVGMAFRAAVNVTNFDAMVIAVGGDIPPELSPDSLQKISAVLIVRGASDDLYTNKQFVQDEMTLRSSKVDVRSVELAAGHEWSSNVSEAASQFLRQCHH